MSDGVRHPLFARLYARMSPKAESRGVAEHRRETLADLRGRVIELGAGNGLNFQHYPTTVSEVVAVEPRISATARTRRRTARPCRSRWSTRWPTRCRSRTRASTRRWRRSCSAASNPRIAGGCHAARDTEGAIRAAGFEIERCRRFNFKGGPVTAPHIIGLARRA